MKTLLYIGGPLILFTGLAFWTDFFTLPSEHPGIVHFSGVPMGGIFQLNTKTYYCDESGNNCVLVEETTEEFAVEGLELEEQAIDYRNGSEDITVRKQPGLSKYTNIHLKRMGDFTFDTSQWKFVPERPYSQDGSLPGVKSSTESEIDFRLDQSADLPSPKNNEDSMESLEIETEELELGE